MRRGLVITLVLVAVGATVIAGVGAAAVWTWHRAALDTTDPDRVHQSAGDPPFAGRSWTTRAGGCSSCPRRPAPATSVRGTPVRPGASTATTWARHYGHAGEQVAGHVHQRSCRRPPPCTGTACTCPPTMDGGPHQPVRPGATWSPTWTDRPAGGHALVPPAPARAHREARATAASPACSSWTTPPRPACDLPAVRRGRHPGHRAGYAASTGTGGFDLEAPALRQSSASSATRSLVNGTVGPVPATCTTQRIRLRLLNASNSRGSTDSASPTDGSSRSSAPTAGCSPAPHDHQTGATHPRGAGRDRGDRAPGERDVLRSSPPDPG